MITLKVNGIEYDNFLSANCERSILEFTSEANFDIALEEGQFPPFLGNEVCEVLIDGEKVITGFIDVVDVSYSSNEHRVSYTVRDRTCDFADSFINNINDLSGSLSLKKIIQIVLSHIGITWIEVIDSTDIAPFDISKDDISPEVGDNCFDYCEGLARKRQVLLTTNADGDIEIVRNSGERYETPLQNSFDDVSNENNIISGTFNYSYVNSFRKYIVKSQLGKASSGLLSFGSVSNEKVSDQNGFFEDKGVRLGRQKVIISEESSTDKDNNEQAKWNANFERAKSSTYSVKVFGHKLGDEVIHPNRLVKVLDDFAEVNEDKLIESVSYDYDVSTGSTSTIRLSDKDSFTLIVNEPLESEEKESSGGLLSFG